MKYPDRIYLVGMPGAGKTRAGRLIAKVINYRFIDLDEAIEADTGKTIAQIFAEEGEDKFREYERKSLRTHVDSNIVVSTGGGAPCFHENMIWMNAHGFTVFLNPRIQLIINRIRSASHRPLFKEQPEKTISDLYSKRKSFYNQSNFETQSESAQGIFEDIRSYLKSKN